MGVLIARFSSTRTKHLTQTLRSLGSGQFSDPLARLFRSLPMHCCFGPLPRRNARASGSRTPMIHSRGRLLLGSALVVAVLASGWLGTQVASLPQAARGPVRA